MKTFKWPIITAVISSIGIFLYLLISKEPIYLLIIRYLLYRFAFLFNYRHCFMDYILWLFDNFQRSMKNAFRFKRKMNRKSLSRFQSLAMHIALSG